MLRKQTVEVSCASTELCSLSWKTSLQQVMQLSPSYLVVLVVFLIFETAFAFCPLSHKRSTPFPPRSTLSLRAKKGKATAKKSVDVTVRLLQDSKEGLGQKGTIVKISAALWTNVYQPKKLAERITEEEEKNVLAGKKEAAEAELQNSMTMKGMLEGKEVPYVIEKKVGSSGQLFGGVKQKDILEIVKSMAPADVATSKWTVMELKGEGDSKVENQKEIREVGSFSAIINLRSDVKAKFKFDIVGEK